MLFLLNVTIPLLSKAEPYLKGHMEFLNSRFESGFFKMFGPYLPGGTGGYAIIEADSEEKALEVLKEDPLTRAGECSNELHAVALGRISDSLLSMTANK